MRYAGSAESPTGATAGSPLCGVYNIEAGSNFSLRRLIIGGRAGTDTLDSQQVTIGVARATNMGTVIGHEPVAPTNNNYSAPPTSLVAVVNSWEVNPTLETTPYLYELSFNTVGGSAALEWEPWVFTSQYDSGTDTETGIVLVNIGNDLPDEYLLTVSFDVESQSV